MHAKSKWSCPTNRGRTDSARVEQDKRTFPIKKEKMLFGIEGGVGVKT